jgi:hypothetical protein
MALRWTAAGFLEAQKSFRKIQGIKDFPPCQYDLLHLPLRDQ